MRHAEAVGPGRRRVRPGGLRRAGRLRELLFSGIVDSFGNSLGWTVVVLLAVSRGGLAEAALYNAAMLGGTVLSAPVTGWLTRRMDGRLLLRLSAGGEMLLRLAVLGGLIAGAPSWLVAAAIAVMNTVAWAGYAGMRAEVTAVDTSPRAMTRYAVGIAGVEAGGTALAALLPSGPAGHPTGWLLTAIFVVYLGSLLPTIVTARRARIPASSATVTRRGRHARTHQFQGIPSPRLMFAGGAIMLLASGPALLAVPVTEELHGNGWVAGAAIAFCLGTLLSTKAVTAIGKLRLPAVLRWSLWGLGMLAGWTLAPLLAPVVLLAQFAAGLCQTAFEGDMDARVAAEASPDSLTRDLAYAASVRALGGAVAVRMLPLLVLAPAMGTAAAVAALALGGTALVLWSLKSIAPHLLRRVA